MGAKIEFKYSVVGGRKAEVLDYLAKLQEKPQHKWIPIEQMRESNRATVTSRQADWIVGRVAKNVEGREIKFEPVATEAEAEAA